ncbi:MAG: hypothetical protein ABIG67_05095, partial [Pseudomonadota bacterium]
MQQAQDDLLYPVQRPNAREVILSTGSLYTFQLERVFEIGLEAGFSDFELLVHPDEIYTSLDRLKSTIYGAGA